MSVDKKSLSAFYCDFLKNDLMKFWDKAWDEEYGGIYTCYSNDGKKRLSTDKYIWSQGRVIWMLAKYAELIQKGLIDDDREKYLSRAFKTYEFVKAHAILEKGQGVCAYLVERDGTKKESIPGKGYYTSFYVDCFVIMGFAELARVSGKEGPLEDALALYDRTQEYLKRNEIVAEPYPVPDGFQAHGVAMIMCNVTEVLYDALKAFRHARYQELMDAAKGYMDSIFTTFYDKEHHLIYEMVPSDPANADTMLAKHHTPGHAIESMWFCAKVAQDINAGTEAFRRIADVVKSNLSYGWDPEYGGLFHFIGESGGEPKGRLLNVPYDSCLVNTWNTKLWWVHSEALYATLLCYSLTGDEEFADLYKKVSDYVFRVFPNPDKSVGEWIQIHDRQNRPLNKVVALPVKDPYHIARDVMMIIELLAK